MKSTSARPPAGVPRGRRGSPGRRLAIDGLGVGLRGDIERARREGSPRRLVELLRVAASRGDAEALTELGMHSEQGLADGEGQVVVRKDRRGALKRFRQAAELGDPEGMVWLAGALQRVALRLGPSARTRAALAEAMTWERRALRKGSVTAAYNLAVSYRDSGRPREALRRFRQLAAAGDESALLEVAKAELLGVGTRRDAAGAFRKLERVARRGSTATPLEREQAMLILAAVLGDGWAAPRDPRGSVRWLRRAARAGSSAAAGMLEDVGESSGSRG